MRLYPNGLGEATGDSLVTSTAPFYTSGNVWWVLSTIGTDAASPRGQDREAPLATLAQAVTNSADGDTIVLRDGHTETRTAVLTIAKRLTIVAGGRTAAGLPTVSLSLNAANASLLSMTAIGVELRNILFLENVQSNASASGKVVTGAESQRIIGCYFQCGVNDASQAAVQMNGSTGSFHRLDGCTFISTPTSGTGRPSSGVLGPGIIVNGNEVMSCTFDDGAIGWSGHAFNCDAQPQGRVRALGNTLLNGASFRLSATATGYAGVTRMTGGAQLLW